MSDVLYWQVFLKYRLGIIYQVNSETNGIDWKVYQLG